MAVVYEVNIGNTCIQVTKDLVFGWVVRYGGGGCDFGAVSMFDVAQLRFLQWIDWPAYIPSEFKDAVEAELAKKILQSTKISDTAATVAVVEGTPVSFVAEENRSAVVDSWLKIYQLILENLRQSREYTEHADVADLGYCRVIRHGSGKWNVTNNDGSEKSKDFENVQDAVVYIARVWW